MCSGPTRIAHTPASTNINGIASGHGRVRSDGTTATASAMKPNPQIPTKSHEDPGVRRAVPAELAYVLANRRVVWFESAASTHPPTNTTCARIAAHASSNVRRRAASGRSGHPAGLSQSATSRSTVLLDANPDRPTRRGRVQGVPRFPARPLRRASGPQLSFRLACQHRLMRLLVVDDDPSVREALGLVLDLNGFGVSTATDGAEAIRTLSVDRPDAVILDVLMPGLDGLEVCRRMRATGDRTPVLMLTARAEVSERVAGLEAGADDYLVKPFASEELIARLRALLRRTGWEGDERRPCASRIWSSIPSRTRPAAGVVSST